MQRMLYPQYLGKQPQVTSVEGTGNRDSAMKSGGLQSFI